jgi:hypothetical protein
LPLCLFAGNRVVVAIEVAVRQAGWRWQGVLCSARPAAARQLEDYPAQA